MAPIDLPPLLDMPAGYERSTSGLLTPMQGIARVRRSALPGFGAFPGIMVSGRRRIAETPIVILITSGASFTVPAAWNSDVPGLLGFANKIECIGGGAKGNGGSYTGQPGGTGGPGGSYSAIQDLPFIPGAIVSHQVGAGTGTTAQADTYFNGANFAGSSVAAKGRGGSASNGIGTVKFQGGSGQSGSSPAGGRGGSAARPTANGTPGGPQSAVLWTDNSGGPNHGLVARSGGAGDGATDYQANGNPGLLYGGGGGGGASSGNFSGGGAGGNGANGIIAITFYPYI